MVGDQVYKGGACPVFSKLLTKNCQTCPLRMKAVGQGFQETGYLCSRPRFGRTEPMDVPAVYIIDRKDWQGPDATLVFRSPAIDERRLRG